LFFERVRECDYVSSFCLEWNSDGKCEREKCEERHHCLYCSSSHHASFECAHALEMFLMESVASRGFSTPTLSSTESSAKTPYPSPAKFLPVSLPLENSGRCAASSFGFRSPGPQPGSLEARGLKRGATIPCFHFNRAENGCRNGNCNFLHQCVVCGGDHSFSTCPRRDFCMEFTKFGICHTPNFKNRHWCVLCHEKHPFGDPLCTLFSDRIREGDNPITYCLDHNAAGDCEARRTRTMCPDKHKCLFCHSDSHGSFACHHGVAMLINVEHGGSLHVNKKMKVWAEAKRENKLT
jgi:hypothetical protein